MASEPENEIPASLDELDESEYRAYLTSIETDDAQLDAWCDAEARRLGYA